MIDYQDLLEYTAKEYLDCGDLFPLLSKTKLLKLTYLVEYFYYKKQRVRLTNAEWVHLYYGPYIFDYEKFLARCPFSIDFLDEEHIDYKVAIRDEPYAEREIIKDFDIKMIIKRIIKEYGSANLNEILDFIYFDTEPMQFSLGKHCPLIFEHILPEEKNTNRQLDHKEIKHILERFKERKANARSI